MISWILFYLKSMQNIWSEYINWSFKIFIIESEPLWALLLLPLLNCYSVKLTECPISPPLLISYLPWQHFYIVVINHNTEKNNYWDFGGLYSQTSKHFSSLNRCYWWPLLFCIRIQLQKYSFKVSNKFQNLSISRIEVTNPLINNRSITIGEFKYISFKLH